MLTFRRLNLVEMMIITRLTPIYRDISTRYYFIHVLISTFLMPEENEISESDQRVYFFLSSLMLVLGIIIYVSWGLIYGSWNVFERTNLGIYALTVVICGFGILGIILNFKR